MLVASNNHKLVFAQNVRPGEQYYCPACRQPVRLRRGKSKVPHFAHLPGADCAVSEGETGEHLRGKQQLFDHLRKQGLQPQLEVYLPAIRQRPDILVRHADRVVAVEFQCSPLTVQRLLERNAGYRRLGIKPLWLLGQPYRRRLSSEKVAQFTQLIGGQPTVLYWNTTTARVEYERGFYRCSFAKGRQPRSKLLQRQTIALTRTQVGDLLVSQLAERVWNTVHQPLAHCPVVCHDLAPTWPVTRVALIYWRIAVVTALMARPLFSAWSPAEWRHWLWQCGQPYWLTFACAPITILTTVFNQLTADLVAAQVIHHCGGRYVLFCHPYWFANLAEKYASLNGTGNHRSNRVKLLSKER